MRKRKKIKTNQDFLEKFSMDFFKNDNILLLSQEKSENYPALSGDHLYYLAISIARLIFYAFESGRPDDDDYLHIIQLLNQVIKNKEVLNEKDCDSDDIKILFELNAGNLSAIKWYLSEAISPSHYKLEMVDNVTDYRDAVKDMVKEISADCLRNFHNFIVTKPELSETEQKIADAIRLALMPTEHTLPSPEQTVPQQYMQPA